MRKPEDPCRDTASEARDDWEQLCQPLTDEERRENARKIEALSVPDRFALMFSHASEPRPTPETDALVPSQGRIRTMREYIDELEAHARRLERQRDDAKAIINATLKALPVGCIPAHTQESLPGRVADLVSDLGRLTAMIEDPAEVELAMIRGDIAIPDRVEFDGIRDTPAGDNL
jgi:hypothetical protein